MKTYLDCYPCFLRQALEAGRISGMDEGQQHKLLKRVISEISEFEPESSPPEMGYRIHRIVQEEVCVPDPYRAAKDDSTQHALRLYPDLKKLVEESPDPLETAVRLCIAGNIIDLGVSREYDLESTIDRVLVQSFAVNDLDAFRESLRRAERVLFLADNAGETVFDRILIETLPIPTTYVAKGGPIINDATLQDARDAGLDQVAELIDNGACVPGTLLEHCSPEFRGVFEKSDLIIAKGQGNYESLSGSGAPVFFLLQAKCPVIASDLGVTVKSIVIKQENGMAPKGHTASYQTA